MANQTVEQSIEIIRRRLDPDGTKEPVIQRQGRDRILVQLPGVNDPERIKRLIGRTARLTFQLVDMRSTAQEARARVVFPREVCCLKVPMKGAGNILWKSGDG